MDTMTAAFNLVRDYPGGAVALAPVLGKSPSTLSHEVNGKHPGAKFGLADAVKLSLWSDDRRICSAFASELGCMLIPLPEGQVNVNSFSAIAAMAKEFGDLVSEVHNSIGDGRISPNELKRVQSEACQLTAAVESLVQYVGHMAKKSALREEAVL